MKNECNELVELTDEQSESVHGGNNILAISSNLGHVGRAFAFGYAIGTAIHWFASQGGDSDLYYAP